MYMFPLITFFLLLAICHSYTEDSEVAQAFIDNRLVPNIVDEAPQNYLRVSYSHTEVRLGNYLRSSQTLEEPYVTYEANKDDLYTLVLFGPDAPSHATGKNKQFLYWLVVNIPKEDIESSDVVSPYISPAVFDYGSPYVFLLYKQNSWIDPETLPELDFLRIEFNANEFKSKYNLTGPVAGNLMRISRTFI